MQQSLVERYCRHCHCELRRHRAKRSRHDADCNTYGLRRTLTSINAGLSILSRSWVRGRTCVPDCANHRLLVLCNTAVAVAAVFQAGFWRRSQEKCTENRCIWKPRSSTCSSIPLHLFASPGVSRILEKDPRPILHQAAWIRSVTLRHV